MLMNTMFRYRLEVKARNLSKNMGYIFGSEFHFKANSHHKITRQESMGNLRMALVTCNLLCIVF